MGVWSAADHGRRPLPRDPEAWRSALLISVDLMRPVAPWRRGSPDVRLPALASYSSFSRFSSLRLSHSGPPLMSGVRQRRSLRVRRLSSGDDAGPVGAKADLGRLGVIRSGGRGPRGWTPPWIQKGAPRTTTRYGSAGDCAITVFQSRPRSVRALRRDRKPDARRSRVAQVRAHSLCVKAGHVHALDRARYGARRRVERPPALGFSWRRPSHRR